MSGVEGRRAAERRSSARNAVHPKLPPLTGNSLAAAPAGPYTEIAVKRRMMTWITVIALAAPEWLRAGGNSWNKLRYAGGTVVAKVNDFDWNTTLTVEPDAIVVNFAHRTTLRLTPAQITALSYGQEAHRRVADMVALSFIVTPVALFGLLHKSKVHFIGIEFRTPDGKPGAILLEADKNNYRAILLALKTVTGKPVENEPKK